MIIDNFQTKKPHYILYNNVFSDKDCDGILELQSNQSITLTNQKNSVLDNYQNKNNLFIYETCTLQDSELYEKILMNYVLDANARIFGFNIWGIEKDLEILNFKDGYYYDWHEDILKYSTEPNDRKLVVYAFINGDDVNGNVADIHFKIENEVVSGKKGSVIIFPSFLTYSIKASSASIRQVLHCHIIGPKFK